MRQEDANMNQKQEFDDRPVDLEKLMELIETLLAQLEKIDKDGDMVLFIGPTGAGKSTLVNYLCGTRYEIKHDAFGGVFAQYLEGAREVTRVGMDPTASETLFPQISKKEGCPFLYCDLGGLFDSRGSEEQVCAAISAMLLSRLAKSIRAIVVVCAFSDLQTVKGEAFKNTAHALGKILQIHPEHQDRVHFVITKVPPEYSEPEFRRQFDLSKMVGIKFEKMNLFTPDISDRGASRQTLESVLANMQPKLAADFNFYAFDTMQIEFNSQLLSCARAFLTSKKAEEDYLARLVIIDKSLSQAPQFVLKLEKYIDALQAEKSAQAQMDRIIISWIRVEELKRGIKWLDPEIQAERRLEINQLLLETMTLLLDLNQQASQSLPEKIAFINIVLSHKNIDRRLLIQDELRERRWNLPRQRQSNGEVDGYGIVLQGEIAHCEGTIAKILEQCRLMRQEKEQIEKQRELLQIQKLSSRKIWGIVYRLIDILDYQDKEEDYRHFQDQYEQTYLNLEEVSASDSPFRSHFFRVQREGLMNWSHDLQLN